MEQKEETEAGAKATDKEEEQVVNPWEVSAKDGGKIDYDKLIDRFGCQRLGQSHIQRIERLTSRPAHVFLRRGVFFAHRYPFFLSLFLFFFLTNIQWLFECLYNLYYYLEGDSDFNEILDAYERGEKFYLYTGRGPSTEALHLGHLVPFMFTK